ncbi:DUF2608 domain-containing protein [Bdellovibrio bacteriovorus]
MKFIIAFIISFSFLQAQASEKIQIKSMQEVLLKVEQYQKVYSPSQILLVFDIDNTILTTEKDLGGDAWFSWQEEKLKNKDTADLAAPDFDSLLRVQGYLFTLGKMKTPETMTPALLNHFQQQGFPLFLLTSRGADFQNVTQKELARHGYNPALTAPGPLGGFASRFTPINVQQPSENCLTPQELTLWGIKDSRPSVYEDGVFYTSGQHKGAMLRAILCKVRQDYPVIIFVDDHEKHVDRVLKAYEGSTVDVVSMRYGAMDPQVERFKKSDKQEVISEWNKIKAVLEEVFGAY